MKVEYLKEMLVLSETLNFSNAARALDISQPVLSAHIKSLENEFGLRLFDRDKHSVSLTDVGTAMLPTIRNLIMQHERLGQIVSQFANKISSQLDVGYLYNAFRRVIPHITRRFSNEFPDTGLYIHSTGYLELTNALLNERFDIALTIDVDKSLHDSCDYRVLGKDVICCVVRKDDPLAQIESVSLKELEGEPFILPTAEASGGYDRFVHALFQNAGFDPLVAVSYKEIDTRYLAIEAGEGIGLVGAHFQPYMNEDLRFIPLEDEYARYDLVAMWKKSNQNGNVGHFIEILAEEFETTPPRG